MPDRALRLQRNRSQKRWHSHVTLNLRYSEQLITVSVTRRTDGGGDPCSLLDLKGRDDDDNIQWVELER